MVFAAHRTYNLIDTVTVKILSLMIAFLTKVPNINKSSFEHYTVLYLNSISPFNHYFALIKMFKCVKFLAIKSPVKISATVNRAKIYTNRT